MHEFGPNPRHGGDGESREVGIVNTLASTVAGDDPSSYDGSYDLMHGARKWNLERIPSILDAGAGPIIVDSGNVHGPFTKQYVDHAANQRFEIRFRESESDRLHTICELLKDKQANAAALRLWSQRLAQVSKNTHRMPFHDIVRRINRWEETSVEQFLAVA